VAGSSEAVFLTRAEVAARLQGSRATVYALIARGDLIARRVGLALRIGIRELEAFLSERSGAGNRIATKRSFERPGTTATNRQHPEITKVRRSL
jgi:excisionase family DNA binding protein